MHEEYVLVDRMIRQISSNSRFSIPEMKVLQQLRVTYQALTHAEFIYRLISEFFNGSEYVLIKDGGYCYDDEVVHTTGMGDRIMTSLADIITNATVHEVLRIDICDMFERVINLIGVFISYLFPIRNYNGVMSYQFSYFEGGLFSWRVS